jgi:drug/metabolite transporter (DMT)-like permease
VSKREDCIPYLGEFLSLSTAITWAIAVILFKKSGESVHPIALNFFKDFMAVILLIPTMYLMGETLFYRVSSRDYLIIFVSGALGIGVADTLFFMSLNRLGASLMAIVDCLYSPFVIAMSFMFLAESLNPLQVFGVILIISAVLTATQPKARAGISSRNLFFGILFGVLAMAANAAGIVMVKPVLERSPLIWITEMRLLSGVIVLAMVLLFHPRRRKIMNSLNSIGSWQYTILGSFFGAYLSMVFWLGGMKYKPASISASLNQTSNVFVFIFAAVFLKEAINLQKTLAIIMAILGVFIVTFG